MRILTASLLIVPLIAAAHTQSADVTKPARVERVPTHTPEWTDSNDSDPGTTDSTMSNLQSIVVLCATEPQSPAFKDQWTAYVRKHYEPGMDVGAVIDDVLMRAAAYRAEQERNARGKSLAVADASTRKIMHDSAMNAVRNMK